MFEGVDHLYNLLYVSKKNLEATTLGSIFLSSSCVFFFLFNVISSSKQNLFVLGSVSTPLVMTFRRICGILFSEEDLRRPCYKYGVNHHKAQLVQISMIQK